MKLLYITNGINGSGGLERVLSVKASLLAEEFGYEVGILCLNEGHLNPFYTFSSKIKTSSIAVSGNPISYFSTYKKGIQKAVNDFNPDVISVCDDGLKGFFLPRIIRTKAKWIYERHASIQLNKDTSLKGKITKALMRFLGNDFDKFVVLTPTNRNEWSGKNLLAIPNPISFESQRKSSLDNKKIIVVGSHSYNKGYDLLVKLWQKMEKKYPEWELNIYGKMDKDKTFVRMSEDLDLKNIRFHHPVRDIKEKYLESSIMLLTSRSEGFGMVLIEAMECGVPCISFDCPSGPADIIENGADGFLVPSASIDEMAEKLSLLIENEALRKSMGQEAKNNVKRFSAQTIVEQWDKLFKE